MTSIDAITFEVADTAAARRFYAEAFGLGSRLRLRAGLRPATGFRGFTLSLMVSQPADVKAVVDVALDAGAALLQPVAESVWGCGGVVQAPDETVWKVVTSAKKNTGPATSQINGVRLVLGVTDVGLSKQFYIDRGFSVAKRLGRMYVEFATAPDSIRLALYRRSALAKDAGVSPEGAGSHRIAINGAAAPFTDPDGFEWETAVS